MILRLPRPRARALMAGGVLAAGLFLVPISLRAQEPAGKDAGPSEKAAATSTLEARLRMQRLRTRKARATYDIARLNREIAEIAV